MTVARTSGGASRAAGTRSGRAAAALLLAAAWATATSGGEWARALAPRTWSFPRDHGAHPAYRTEWWYFTGTLADAGGRRFGYQLTFFRQGVAVAPRQPANPWSVRDLYLAHLAVTDAAGGTFRYRDRASRSGPGLAGAATGGLDVWLLDWSARAERGDNLRLRAGSADLELELDLSPRKPVVLHGERGLSRKGSAPGQASYYASLTDLATRGRLRLGGGAWVAVTGTSWFDQEFGSNQLAADQAGWDWVSLHLSDRRDLMVYVLRRTDGTVEASSSGTLVEADGSARHLRRGDFTLSALERWTSPRSGGRYPSRWRLRVPSAAIDLELRPWVADQELVTAGSTGVTYWEGAVGGRGASGGLPVACEGYVELTGYAGRLGGVF